MTKLEAFEQIVQLCTVLDFCVAAPVMAPGDAVVPGFVIGTRDYVDDLLGDIADHCIFGGRQVENARPS